MRPGRDARPRTIADRLRRWLPTTLSARRAAKTAGRAVLWPYAAGTQLRDLSGSTTRPLTLRSRPSGSRRGEMAPDATRLVSTLRAARRRLWVARSVAIAGRVAFILAGAMLLFAVARLLNLRPLTVLAVSLGILLTALGAGIIALQRVTDLDAARVLDRRLGLRERLGTALDLLDGQASGPIAERQLREAAALAGDSCIARTIVPLLPRRDLLRGGFSLVLSAILLAASALTPPHATVDGASPTGAQQSAAEVTTGDWTEIAKVEDATLDLKGGDPETAARLAELKRQLDSGEISAQQYADQVSRLEEGLRQRAAESARQQEALARLADALKDSSATRDVANSLNRGDYAGAAQQMASLADQSSKLSDRAREELAGNLSTAAESVGDRSQNLADSAEGAADSLRGGDRNAAQDQLRNLADQVAKAGSAVAPQSAMADALQQLNESRAQTGGASGQLAETQQPGAGQGNGEGQPKPGAQSGEGNGAGDRGEQAAAGDGADRGGGAGSGPGSRTLGRGDGRDSAAPNQTVLRIDGKPTDAGTARRQDAGGTPLTTTQSGVSSVRASDAFKQSSEPVNTVGEQNFVPFEMKPVVKDYFSGNPGADGGVGSGE